MWKGRYQIFIPFANSFEAWEKFARYEDLMEYPEIYLPKLHRVLDEKLMDDSVNEYLIN